MLNKAMLLAVLCVFFLSETALAAVALIQNSGNSSYKSVRITPEVARKANTNLSDILVTDDKGVVLPYFISSSSSQTRFTHNDYPMTLLNSYIKDDAFYLDYRLTDLPDSDVMATSININTQNRDFAKNLVIYGSYDNIHWELVQDDIIYNVDGNIKLQIDFNRPQKFTHYRFRLENNLEKISFESVHLNYSFENTSELYFEETISPNFSVEEIDKYTKIYIHGLRNLRVKDIEILTDSTFKRDAIAEIMPVAQEIFNLSFDGTKYSQTVIDMPNTKIRDDTLTLTINNNDDTPIDIAGINLRYYADEVIFEDKGSETFNLEFSADGSISAPVYDIESYKNEILKRPVDSLSIVEISHDEVVEIVEESFDFKLIYNIGILAVCLLLGFLILLKLKPKNKDNKQ